MEIKAALPNFSRSSHRILWGQQAAYGLLDVSQAKLFHSVHEANYLLCIIWGKLCFKRKPGDNFQFIHRIWFITDTTPNNKLSTIGKVKSCSLWGKEIHSSYLSSSVWGLFTHCQGTFGLICTKELCRDSSRCICQVVLELQKPIESSSD